MRAAALGLVLGVAIGCGTSGLESFGIFKELIARGMTAAKEAEYQQALKLVDVARERVASETSVKVAGILADGRKTAAETDAFTAIEDRPTVL